MHFVFISTLHDPQWGGSESLWSSAAARALQEGHVVSVFVSEREKLEAPLADLQNAGAKLFFWRPKYPPLSLVQRVHKRLAGRKLPQWEWWHRNLPKNADAICVSQGGMFCAMRFHGCADAIRASHTPYVLLARCDSGIEFLDPSTRSQAKVFLENAASFVAASRSTVDLARSYLPSELANASVLHSPLADYGGSDEMTAGKFRVQNGVKSGGSSAESAVVEMACVGRLRVADKGQHLLLACLAEQPWRLRPVCLSFYGEGPDRKYLEELVEFYGLGERVRFAGHTCDVAGIWRRSHLAVQPSFVEGTPQSLLEAMLCRRPCVATAVGGIPDWLEEGKTGFVAEAPTVRCLRLALERAWDSRDRWNEIGEAARATCLEKRDPNPEGTLLALLREAAQRGEAERLKS